VPWIKSCEKKTSRCKAPARRSRITFVVVTHDQEEAMTLANAAIGVMNNV